MVDIIEQRYRAVPHLRLGGAYRCAGTACRMLVEQAPRAEPSPSLSSFETHRQGGRTNRTTSNRRRRESSSVAAALPTLRLRTPLAPTSSRSGSASRRPCGRAPPTGAFLTVWSNIDFWATRSSSTAVPVNVSSTQFPLNTTAPICVRETRSNSSSPTPIPNSLIQRTARTARVRFIGDTSR